MAAQTNGNIAEPDPVAVGNAFIDQYYRMLINNPEHIHKFYKEGSRVSRPGLDGEMTSITTTKCINEKILSLKYDKCRADIISADSQTSYKGGVSVLVTGVLTVEDGSRRMFTQSFFLAPQDPGFYVHNDMFRYVDVSATPIPQETIVDIAEAPEAIETAEAEVSENSEVEDVAVKEEVTDLKEATLSEENGNSPVAVKEVIVESSADLTVNDATSHPAAAAPSPVAQGDGSKKSFASIVNALKTNSSPFQVRASPVKAVEKPRAPAAAPEAPVQTVPNGNVTAEKTSGQPVKRHSVFVGNLPLDATPAILEAAFKRFGPIKRNGIQVRSSKGSCYGFVEFESESSMHAALEETSILVGNRTAHIEEQRNDGDKGRGPQGRGGFRENFRGGRGNFGGGRGYGRNDFDRKFDYSSRGGRNGGGSFNREYSNGSGRVPRQQQQQVVKE